MNKKQNQSEKIEELIELCNVPEVGKFLLEALEKAKQKFKDKIDKYMKLKRESEKKKKIPSFENGWSKNKSYFFELNRVEDRETEEGYKWTLGKFKLSKRKDIVEMIFSAEFKKEIDQAVVTPQQPESIIIDSPTTKKRFDVDYMKSSKTRVIGFVKEIMKDEEKYILKDNPAMRMIAAKHQDIDKEEMYHKIHQLMEEDEEVRKDMFFYLVMMETSRGENSKEKNSQSNSH
jgi:hypothetical protein